MAKAKKSKFGAGKVSKQEAKLERGEDKAIKSLSSIQKKEKKLERREK